MAKTLIYWGYYSITRGGKVTREKPGKSTYIGKVLQPFNGDCVTLSINNKKYRQTLRRLKGRAF